MTRTALEAFHDKTGVCRDYAHLAVAFCRCMNIPARYCTGYLGDIGMPPPYGPMDFAAWFEVFLGGHWYTFDARNNTPRIGRVLIARGRDASRRRDQQHVRPEHAGELQGLDRRSARHVRPGPSLSCVTLDLPPVRPSPCRSTAPRHAQWVTCPDLAGGVARDP